MITKTTQEIVAEESERLLAEVVEEFLFASCVLLVNNKG